MAEQRPNSGLSGDFGSAVAPQGEAVDARGSQGLVYKPQGPVAITQHFYSDAAAAGLYPEKLKRAEERRWQEKYEHLRIQANAGYADTVREEILETLSEIDSYEEIETVRVSSRLKSRLYRLGAIVYLPHQTGGDAGECASFLNQAKALSEAKSLIQCQVTEALLLHETGDTEPALNILSNLAIDEAIRLRFAIYVETNRTDDCSHMIEDGVVDPSWCEDNPDWARALLGYYTLEGRRQTVEDTLDLLIREAPTAESYRVGAQSLVRVAYARMQEFCLAQGIFPDLHIGLDLDELIDRELSARAAGLFAESARLYRQHSCKADAADMLAAAIRLATDSCERAVLTQWVAQLKDLDPDNPLLVGFRQSETTSPETVKHPPSILDLHPLLEDPSTDPLYVLRAATAVSNTPSRAAEVASILQQEVARFEVTDSSIAHLVFVVLQLWTASGDREQAMQWLEQSASLLSHPRLDPLFRVWLHLDQDNPRAAKTCVGRALSVAPDHPEVLAAAIIVYHRTGDRYKRLDYARSLFDILRTRQTADWYLGALWDVGDFQTFLDVLNDTQELLPDETLIRGNRARALVALDRALEAQDDLEWLRDERSAKAVDLIALAKIYQLRGESDKAIATLLDCIEAFPDTTEAYLLLSHFYLLTGRRGESFEWLLRARRRFPESRDVLLNLWFISHSTGHELHPEVGKAFRAFMPGGRFADDSPFIPFTVEELVELANSRQEEVPQPETLYRTGQIPRMLLCLRRNIPMYTAHQRANLVGEPRYVGDGDQSRDIAQLMQAPPREIVLDYSALLTLWSLFEADLLSHLSPHFDRVWIPETLRALLLIEQDQLATRGQPARYEARRAVSDALGAWTDKVTIHPEIHPGEKWGAAGIEAGIALSRKVGLLHLHEHIPPSESPRDSPTIGLHVLAGLLEQVGEISPLVSQELRENTRLPFEGEAALAARLREERQIVASVPALVTWALYQELRPVLEYLEHIHIAQPALDRLRAEIRGYELHQECVEGIRSLRRLLRQGEEAGLIVFGTTTEEERIIRQMVEQQRIGQQAEGENPSDPGSGPRPLFRYLDDYLDQLIGIACREDIPIWTDDRWTKKLRVEACQPPYCFGTDSFLAFAHKHANHGESLSAAEYHTYHDRLVTWGYYFLPINADHVLWHLRRGVDPESKPLEDLLRHSRERLIEIWDLSDEQPQVDEEFGTYLLGLYNGQVTDALRHLYKNDVSTEVGGAIFATLDLSRHAAPRILGREPFFFTSLFLHAVMPELAPESGDAAIELPSVETVEYSEWLNRVMLESGVAQEVIEEAWYQLVRYPLAMLDAAQTAVDRRVALSFLQRMLEAMPVHATQYVLTTDIGPRLREEFDLHVHQQVFFKPHEDTGDGLEICVSVQDWERDYMEALASYLTDASRDVVSAGLVTLKVQQVAEGSVFLTAEEIPSEIYNSEPDARGVIKHINLLPGFTRPELSHRRALWRIGRQALQRHQTSTEAWDSQMEELLLPGEKGVRTGNELRQRLLGVRSIAQEYFAQAIQLSPSSVVQLLTAIEPTVVRAWLSMHELDWSSGDDLREWAEQSASRNADEENQPGVIDLFDQFGCTVFPDAPIVRRHARSALNSTTSLPEQFRTVEQLLSFAENHPSLTLKANVVLVLNEWLGCREEQSRASDGAWDDIGERISTLTVLVLQDRALDDSQHDSKQQIGTTLEAAICRWLYQVWAASVPSGASRIYELAYLASIGAVHIVNALAQHGQITQQAAQGVVDMLRTDLKRKTTIEGIERQPDGVYRPVWEEYLNYAASFLLEGLLADGLPALDSGSISAVTAAALACGVRHRREQAFCSPVSPEPSWIDAELARDIGAACAKLVEELGESERGAWSEQQRALLAFAASVDSAESVRQTAISSIPEVEDEETLMQRILWLFQGRVQPCATWFDTLQHLFEPDILDRIRQSEACYGEVMWRLGDLLMYPSESCPSDLLSSCTDLLFELPVGEKDQTLLRIKAHVLSQLVGLGLDLEPVCQWLIKLAQNDRLEVAVVRPALRPFILLWPHYAEETRDPLFATLMEVAQLPEYDNLWEFDRLTRHARFHIDGEASNPNGQ
jgi:tetratricopeptide (TPR) repeat protein